MNEKNKNKKYILRGEELLNNNSNKINLINESTFPINQIGIRHPVMCSDGYMYEEKCLQGWKKINATSPINRTLIEFVKPCDKNDKCLNSFEGKIEEDYERSNFTFTLNGNIVEFYDKILYLETTQPRDFVIFNRNLMMDLVKIN